MRRFLAAATTVAMVLMCSIAFTQPAAAATITRSCSSTAQMCLHYNSIPYGLGAEFGSNSNIPSLNPNVNGGTTYAFKAGLFGSAGAGVSVWNNAGGAENLSTYRSFRVYVNSNYMGGYDHVSRQNAQSLSATWNDNASMR